MKHLSNNKLLMGILLLVIIIGCGLYIKKDWVRRNYYRIQTERTVSKELSPLKASLKALGFDNLNNLQTSCTVSNPAETSVPLDNIIDREIRPGKYIDCSSAINQFKQVPADRTAFLDHAKELSKALRANGWESRADYPTVQWFESLSKDVDYQPDQYNHKSVSGWDCVIDFYTAFSKPAPTAFSMQFSCNRSIKLAD